MSKTAPCKMTTSKKHIPVEVVLYDAGERLTDPNVQPKQSFKYWRCMACQVIDDLKVWQND